MEALRCSRVGCSCCRDAARCRRLPSGTLTYSWPSKRKRVYTVNACAECGARMVHMTGLNATYEPYPARDTTPLAVASWTA